MLSFVVIWEGARRPRSHNDRFSSVSACADADGEGHNDQKSSNTEEKQRYIILMGIISRRQARTPFAIIPLIAQPYSFLIASRAGQPATRAY